ncbi:phage tail tape measure protein [Cellulomonas timonensis]|uniref:phage tail tape measure protein n=1 Tax=Cellulomonas timonensis TaxID=1689271 RepID=UPI000831CBF1|nr:phage tail tape measure protein [Cellulomonas timonensis]
MAASGAKDFVVNILGDSEGVDKTFKLFQDNAGKAAAGAAAAFAGQQIGNALAANLDAERINDELTASLGATPAQAEAWGAAAGALYRDAYGENLGEVSAAVETVVSSIDGMREASEQDLADVTGQALDVAKAFKVDVADAATTAGLLVKSGLAGNATEALDLITAGLQKVPVALRGDVLEATKEYSTYFAQLGLDGDQAMGLLVAASANGTIAIDKTGDALKELTIRGTDMSKASVEAYEAAGLSASDMAAKFLAGGDVGAEALSQLVGGLQGITDPAAQANAAIALFGTPIEDIGTDKIPEFLASLSAAETGLGDTAGAAAAMGEQLNGNPQSSVESMRRSVEGWVQDLVNLPGPMGDAALATQAFGGDTLNLVGSVGMAVVAMQSMNVAKTAGAVASGVATAAQWAWNVAITANPIGLIIVGIAALIAGIVLLVKNWDTVKAAGASAWEWIKGAWSDAGGFFSGIGSAISRTFKGSFNAVAGFWNDSVGKVGFTVPDWVPGVGGRKFSVPRIPMLASGGEITAAGLAIVGEAGPELLSLPVGAEVIPLSGKGTANGSESAGAGNGKRVDVRIGTLNTGADPAEMWDEIEWRARR